MCDFVEIWDLRNKLISDGFYKEDKTTDSFSMEKEIMRLAREHYGWKEPQPTNNTKLMPETEEWLDCMTPEERLSTIGSILIDWDGYRSVRGLGGLIDEVLSYCYYPNFRNMDNLKWYVSYWNNFDVIKDLESQSKAKIEAYGNDIVTVFHNDMPRIKEWCEKNKYAYTYLHVHDKWNLIDIKIEKEN